MKAPVYLIGGAPTTGKSYMAQMLADYLSLPWISTDQIRSVMQVAADKTKWPELFRSEGHTAESYNTKYSAEEVVDKEFAQGAELWQGLKALIQTDYFWSRGCIAEGVGVLPALIKRDFGAQSNVKAVFLVDHDRDRVRNVIFTRGLWSKADTYSDSIKEKEVEWALLHTKRIEAEAKKYNYPVVEITKSSKDLELVLKALGLT